MKKAYIITHLSDVTRLKMIGILYVSSTNNIDEYMFFL